MPAHLSISALPFREEEEEEPSPSYSSFPSSPSESVASLFAKSNDIPLELDADAARSAAASSRDLNVWIRLVSSGSVDRANGKGLYQRAVIIEEERKRREHHRGRIEKQSLDDELSGLPSYGSVTGDSDFMSTESDPIPPTHLPKIFKAARQTNKQRAKADRAHAAWNKLGVDSRRIIREGGKIVDFYNPPKCTFDEWKRGIRKFEGFRE